MFKPMYNGNQYYMYVTVTYKDIRLVGAPPSSIGKFGSDTDNWVWPRHTGDFSLFRVYAGKDNRPADYSPDNQPYQPRHFLPVSLDGADEGDFTMVYGFPGTTNEYLPAIAVQQTAEVLDPAKVAIRDRALKIMDGFMRRDPAIKIAYIAK
ncbi:MAG TPA: S46 family peptidase, partial [Saprospiraceae bacterium]|nr:S46 family peptidase [Saprospiraceae bacterium]